jgi:hypothetical protein
MSNPLQGTTSWHITSNRGYSWALAGFEMFVMVILTIIPLLGRENHGRSFDSGDLVIERD